MPTPSEVRDNVIAELIAQNERLRRINSEIVGKLLARIEQLEAALRRASDPNAEERT